MYRFSSIFLLLLILRIPVNGQDTLSLDFKEAVKLALSNNVSLRIEKNNLESSIATRKESKALYAPSLGGYMSATQLNGQQFDQITGQLFYDYSERANVQVGGRYVLFNGLNRKYTNRQSQANLEAQQYLVNRTEQDIIYNVGSLYLQVLMDGELLRISRKNLEVQTTTLLQIKGFVEAGTRPLSDQLDQEATVSQIEVEVIRSENNLRLDKARLTQTLLLEPGIDVETTEPDWVMADILVRDYELDQLYKTAMQNRPDYKKTLADQQAANSTIAMARSFHYPTLEFFGGIGSNYSSLLIDQTTGESLPFANQLDDNRIISYGFELSIPIYQRGTAVAAKTRAKMAYENAMLQEKDLRMMIYREVQTAYLDFIAAKNEFQAAEKQYAAAEEAYKIQKERYEVGVGNLVELSRSTWTFVDAAGSRAQARYTLLFQKVILDYFTGILNKEGLL